jgi:hypothetical protein
MSELDRRQFVQKAGIGAAAAGALWVAPSVVGYNAAFAGTSCLQKDTLNWNNQTAGNAPVAVTFPAVGSYPALTVTPSLGTIGTPAADTTNYKVSNAPEGGFTGNSLRLGMTCNAAGEGYSVTFTFTHPVYNLSFTIADIDREVSGRTGWQDSVSLTGGTFTFTKATGSAITGTGVTGDPWLGQGTGGVANTSNLGNVTPTFSTPVTSITITYLSGNVLGALQFIAIYNMTWCR